MISFPPIEVSNYNRVDELRVRRSVSMAGVSGPSQFFGDEESTTKVRHSHIYCMISIGACQLEVAYVAILMISHLRRRLLQVCNFYDVWSFYPGNAVQSGIVAYSSIRSTIEIATSCTLTPNMDDRTPPRAIVKVFVFVSLLKALS